MKMMTNSEAISKLQGKKELLDSNGFANLDEFDIAISALEENTKLKAEIEQLKSELEQIEKSFPRLCETCNYEHDLHPCDVCKLKDKWKLKGKVQE
jgi:predicted nuclease with TOPRIM domain